MILPNGVVKSPLTTINPGQIDVRRTCKRRDGGGRLELSKRFFVSPAPPVYKAKIEMCGLIAWVESNGGVVFFGGFRILSTLIKAPAECSMSDGIARPKAYCRAVLYDGFGKSAIFSSKFP